MTVEQLEGWVLKAFENLDTNALTGIDPKVNYSYYDKDYFIYSVQQEIQRIKDLGLKNLVARKSECKYCYPNANAYSFFHPETGEFLIRYVIHQEDKFNFNVEECRNSPITPREDGLPF